MKKSQYVLWTGKYSTFFFNITFSLQLVASMLNINF